MRIDKWLWCARFFKTRALAARTCADGRIRVSSQPIHKAHHLVKPGDVLTFPLGPNIRVVRVLGLAARRGPAPEARLLYEDLAPPRTVPAAEGSRTTGPGTDPAGGTKGG
jgi:ribosome-associated heat shock protein Hsp15